MDGKQVIAKVNGKYLMYWGEHMVAVATSDDLINWTHWNGEPLIKSEYDWENVHAHKPWFVRNKGKNYHFYCALNDKNEGFIALATSE